MKTEIKATKHTDIRGKELLYLIVGEGLNQVIINIGEKTYKAVEELTNPKQPELELGEKLTNAENKLQPEKTENGGSKLTIKS